MPLATFPERFVTLSSGIIGKLADGLLRPLVGSFGLLLLFVLPFDTWGFLQAPHGYAVGQQLDVAEPNWEWQYVQKNLLLFATTGFCLWLIAASYFKPQRHLLRLSCRLLVTALFVLGVVNFYQAVMNGFDY